MLDYICKPFSSDTTEGNAARALLRSLLITRFGTDGEALFASLHKNADGKPLLGGELFVSLSHSHGVAAAAISDRPVGIDIELWSPLSEVNRRVLDRFFPSEETEAAKSDLSGVEFCRFWTRREAAFKAFATEPIFLKDPTEGHADDLLTSSFYLGEKLFVLSVAGCLK